MHLNRVSAVKGSEVSQGTKNVIVRILPHPRMVQVSISMNLCSDIAMLVITGQPSSSSHLVKVVGKGI